MPSAKDDFSTVDGRLREFVKAMCNGTITAFELKQLEGCLERDVQARRFYLAQLSIHATLMSRYRAADTARRQELPTIPSIWRRCLPTRKSTVTWMSVSVALLLAVLGVWRLSVWRNANIAAVEPPPTVDAPLAEHGKLVRAVQSEMVGVVRQATGAKRGGSNVPISVGEIVDVGHLTLNEGSARIALFGGATLTLKSPIDVEFESTTSFIVHEGELLISVADEGGEVIVKTPVGELRDLGTEFGVAVARDGTTDTLVFEGEVQVRQLRPGVEVSQIIKKGMGMRFAPDGRSHSLDAIEMAAFHRRIDLPFTAETPRDQTPMIDEQGYTVRYVKSVHPAVPSPFDIRSLERADDLLDGRIEASEDVTVRGIQVISFDDDTLNPEIYNYTKVFHESYDFPGDRAGAVEDDDSFAIRVTATMIVPETWQYSFVVNVDDGARLRIDGHDVIVDNGIHPPYPSICTVILGAGEHTLELVAYEMWGFARIELGVAVGRTNRLDAFSPLTTAHGVGLHGVGLKGEADEQ